MVKLYYTSTSCGGANFISAFAAGLSIECEAVDLRTHKTASGVDFYQINPKGNVPTIVLDDGTLLFENSATLQWISDQKPGIVAPVAGTQQRWLLQQALSYISSEVHATITHLFNPALPADVDSYIRTRLGARLTFLNENLLANKSFLVGDTPTVADYYLMVVLSWSTYVKVDLSPYPVVKAYVDRVSNLEVVVAAKARMNDATPPTTTS